MEQHSTTLGLWKVSRSIWFQLKVVYLKNFIEDLYVEIPTYGPRGSDIYLYSHWTLDCFQLCDRIILYCLIGYWTGDDSQLD